MEKKQTAVEWLEDELAKNIKQIVEQRDYILIESLFKQAKQMEKEQIIDAYNDGIEYEISIYSTKDAEQYYNETYGN